jgi:hypothetical protein
MRLLLVQWFWAVVERRAFGTFSGEWDIGSGGEEGIAN